MPTRRPRHTITETAPVEQALRRLRALAPADGIDLKELVILGAHQKADDLERNGDAQQRRERELEAFLALRAADGIDAEAGLVLHDDGWARSM
jgi:hypothetical protein